MKRSACKEGKSQVRRYGRGGRSPSSRARRCTLISKGPLKLMLGFGYFQVFVDEATWERREIGLKTGDAASEATVHCIDEMAREGMTMNCIHGGGTGELEISVCILEMPADRGIGWNRASPSAPQSNGIAERATQRRMVITRSQQEKSRRGGELRMFTFADAACTTFGIPHH